MVCFFLYTMECSPQLILNVPALLEWMIQMDGTWNRFSEQKQVEKNFQAMIWFVYVYKIYLNIFC